MEGLVRSQRRAKELTLSGGQTMKNNRGISEYTVLQRGKGGLRTIHHYGAGALVSCK